MLVAAGFSQAWAGNCDRPDVTFKAGQLTITSKGCSLQQVLTAVTRETGIEAVVPASAAAVPVFGVIGPADPVRVISELLDGSPFNCTLVAKADAPGGLLRVVLTERKAFVPDKPAVAAAQPSATPATGARNGGSALAAASSGAGPNQDIKKKEEIAVLPQPADDIQSEQARGRTPIDDETLKKLPQLPQGIPTAMWSLYPQIVQNGGIVPSGPPILPNGQSASAFSNPGAYDPLTSPLLPFDPAFAPKGVIGLPQLPPNIDPAIGRLYPWNLMQLIQSPITLPNIQLPPPAKPLYNH